MPRTNYQLENEDHLFRRDGERSLEVPRHETLWFDDGSVVLIAANTQFRVHKSVLACKSVVFQDLFTVPQPDDAQTVEGCPAVHLTDSAEDLEYVLDVLYHGLRYKSSNDPTWRMVRAFLRISDKYTMDEIRKEALYHLNIYAPDNTEDWDAIFTGSTSCISYEPWEEIDIANNTREPDLQHIHAVALYNCCHLPTKTLILGGIDMYSDARIELSRDDLVACVTARERLRIATSDILKQALRCNLSYTCTGSNCFTARNSAIHSWRDMDLPLYDPLAMTEVDARTRYQVAGVCEPCVEVLVGLHQTARQNILDKLPTYFEEEPEETDVNPQA